MISLLNNYNNRSFVIVYADDILLIAQSFSELQKLLSACENELQLLDIVINIKKSCCLRIDPRCDVSCANISSQDCRLLSWVSELRYLGVFIVRSRVFKFSLVYAKRSFHRAVNSLFGKLLNLASDVVILELVSAKCFPVLLYGLECCQLNKADLQSLDFSSNRLFMKLFRTGSIDVVQECHSYFGIELPSCLIKKRQDKFLSRFNSVDNVFCRYCCKL